MDEVLADDDLDAIVNLTPPRFHAAISRAALEAGRSVFSEKPLATEFEGGRALVELARAQGVRLGCAPDTFLGIGLQTARAAIDRGDIGEPLAANAFMLGNGPEWWHPDPRMFYEIGAGPLFDMGPYYFTALVQLLGPMRSVGGAARISRAKRTITSDPRRGEQISVEVPTHVTSVIEHVGGAISTLVTSFDVPSSRYRNIEIYGTDATLAVPDPNTFEGAVQVKRFDEPEWTTLPPVEGNLPQHRGIGLAEMLWAQRSGRAHRASGDLALHVLEAMEATLRSAERGSRVELTTSTERAARLPAGLAPYTFDD
jgi:predicted dehydrogenase